DDFVVATKVRFGMGDGPNDAGLSRKHILASVEASLRRLNTDHIDLYQMHCWDPGTTLEESLAALDMLVRQGKVRYIGVSNFTGWQLQKAADIAREQGWSPVVSLQPLYNLLDRSTEWELVPVCLNEGIGIIPWSPLRGGWLSGKYRRGMTAPPENTRVETAAREGWTERWSAYANERTWSILDELIGVSDESGKTPAQVALRWLLQRPGVTAPIIGARRLEHLDDNLGATGWELSEEQEDRLTKASEPVLPYPYDIMARVATR
ncbi:MAG: aldo/keto reductase, partial [Rhodothermales bacterium]|nr:aldo/keto reductase [Rhodothermales bacterium]